VVRPRIGAGREREREREECIGGCEIGREGRMVVDGRRVLKIRSRSKRTEAMGGTRGRRWGQIVGNGWHRLPRKVCFRISTFAL